MNTRWPASPRPLVEDMVRRVKIHTVLLDLGGPIRDSRVALNDAHNAAVEKLLGRKLAEHEKFRPDETWKLMGLRGLTKEDAVIPLIWAIKKKELREKVKVDLSSILESEDPLAELKKIAKRYPYEKNKLERHLRRWRETFNAAMNEEGLDKAPLAEGVEGALRLLSDLGIRIAVATAAGEEAGRAYLQKRNVRQIRIIVGKERFRDRSKPHPYTLNAALHDLWFKQRFPTVSEAETKKINIDDPNTFKHLRDLKRGTLYVGDAPTDVEAAKKAGVYAVSITQGMGSERDLKNAGPKLMVRNLLELAQHLKKNKGYLVLED